ncbi:Scytalone dehydratase [Aspergillus fijiensis CBS 313.89]|uniref:Scytalone dehydratase n=1 Tax=Aspergillus fijiensis CBS 313.89 TaxID=1448319 RepID=A0A8G1RMD0_9EURO|nr:Scytalone dehydratase [Aspergillus fijiensis CBS 313.89]RAK74425.1 Scytalone dehydratase [Aspergillus fijiensis CBS 313.89]
MHKTPTFEEITSCQRALFEWADSYDTKDWERLRASVAPTLRIDYRSFLNKLWDAMPRDEFIRMASDPRFLGNPRLRTQHLVGLSAWEKTADDAIVGRHQLRVAHQRYTDETLAEVAVKGHAHGTATMWYARVEGEWRFAGVCPQINWTEFDYDQVFAEGKEHFGEEGGADSEENGH